MGFWSSVGSFISGAVDAVSSIFSSSSSSTHNSSSSSSVQTIYEPDKVKIAELELEIAQTNSENAKMLLQEQKEIIELNARMQGAIIEAEAKSFQHSAEVLKELMKSMNIIAQQRMELLENAQLEVVKKIENLYSDFEKEVQKDNFNFQINQLPQMMDILDKFTPDSSSHKLYSGSIEKQINLNIEFVSRKLTDLSKRQQMLIESSSETKKMVLEQSAKLVEDRMLFLEKQLENRKELAKLNRVEQISEVKKLTN